MSQPPFGQGPGHPPGGQPQQPGGPGYGGPPGGYPQQQGWSQQPPQGGGGGNSNTALIVILVVLLLAGGGLGVFFLTQDDDDEGGGGGGGGGGEAASPEVQEYVDAIVEVADPSDLSEMEALGLDEDGFGCFTEGIVSAIGVDNIPYTPEEIREGADAGWEPEYTLDQAGQIYDHMTGECGADVRGLIMEGLPGEGLTPSQVDCVDEATTDDALRAMMAPEIAGDQAAVESAQQAWQADIEHCRNA